MSEPFSLKGKTALLTGAAGFFGGYFTEALLEAGARVLLIDRKVESLAKLVQKLQSNNYSNVYNWVVDLYDKEGTEKFFKDLDYHWYPDIVVNNAFDFSEKTGFNDKKKGELAVATYEQFEANLHAGIYWAIQTTQIFGSAMKQRGSGSIINICSMYGVVVPAADLYEDTEQFNPPGYSMAKAGLLQFTRYAASFLAPEIRVNAISPGAIPNTEKPTNNPPDPKVSERLLKRIPLKRMGHPTDLTGALIFLASDASRYMTGANIVIDGGFTII